MAAASATAAGPGNYLQRRLQRAQDILDSSSATTTPTLLNVFRIAVESAEMLGPGEAAQLMHHPVAELVDDVFATMFMDDDERQTSLLAMTGNINIDHINALHSPSEMPQYGFVGVMFPTVSSEESQALQRKIREEFDNSEVQQIILGKVAPVDADIPFPMQMPQIKMQCTYYVHFGPQEDEPWPSRAMIRIAFVKRPAQEEGALAGEYTILTEVNVIAYDAPTMANMRERAKFDSSLVTHNHSIMTAHFGADGHQTSIYHHNQPKGPTITALQDAIADANARMLAEEAAQPSGISMVSLYVAAVAMLCQDIGDALESSFFVRLYPGDVIWHQGSVTETARVMGEFHIEQELTDNPPFVKF